MEVVYASPIAIKIFARTINRPQVSDALIYENQPTHKVVDEYEQDAEKFL